MPDIHNINNTEIDLKSSLQNSTTEESHTQPKYEDLNLNDFDIKEKFPKLPVVKTKSKKSKTKKVSEEDITEKQKLIFKILKYQDNPRFGPLLKKLNFKYNYSQLNKSTLETLKEIIQRIYVNINNDGIDKFFDMLVHQTSNTFEKTVSPFYNIEGFTDSILCDETFLNLLERYKIEHTLPDIPIGVQMSLVISKHMLLCNTKNKIKNKQKHNFTLNKDYKIPDIKLNKKVKKELEK